MTGSEDSLAGGWVGLMLDRLGLTQEIGPAREEGTILLSGPAIVPILWNDFTKS